MSSSPLHSDTLVGTASPEVYFNHPELEVSDLVNQARLIRDLPESVSQALSCTNGSFYDLISMQVQLIRRRSAAWNDHQVTVYDKVLVTLTSNGNDVRNIPAVVFFCKHYLGNDLVGDRGLPANGLPATIARRLHVHKILDEPYSKTRCDSTEALTPQETVVLPSQELASSPSEISDVKTSVEHKDPPSRRDMAANSEAMVRPQQATLKASMKPTVARLWKVLERAKQDFSSVESRTDDEATQAAKYLRDTAENAIQCLQDRSLDESLISEAERLYARAEQKVLDLNGGRKRKFDSSVAGRRRPCRRADSRSSSPYQDRNAEHYNSSSSRSKYRTRENLKGSDESRDDTPRPRKVKHEGRGPSGIPYGYTRPVDQYTPTYPRR